MDFELRILCADHIAQFKKDMQDAFRQGAEDIFGETDEEILPESHIDRAMDTEGAVAYEAFVDGKSAGGAVVVIDEKTQHNHLAFLYVKLGAQSKGVGQKIWKEIEELHPDTKIWETCTPYFEKRNIHFYINCCRFHAVEFFHKYHPEPNAPDSETADEEIPGKEHFEGMFRFEKVMEQ